MVQYIINTVLRLTVYVIVMLLLLVAVNYPGINGDFGGSNKISANNNKVNKTQTNFSKKFNVVNIASSKPKDFSSIYNEAVGEFIESNLSSIGGSHNLSISSGGNSHPLGFIFDEINASLRKSGIGGGKKFIPQN